jgi:hypothetical protein
MRLMVPAALEERIGNQGSAALTEMLSASADFTLTQCTDRFERRLVEETAKLRVEIAQMRSEFRSDQSSLRTDFHEGLSSLRVELLRWAFVFWIGQVVSIGGLVALLLRARG